MVVQEGEVFGIVGGSGSGKSVLLRSILGLQKPRAGKILLGGREIGSLTSAEMRHVKAGYGVTFQHGALFSSLTVLQNVQLPMIEYLDLEPRWLDELAMLKIRLVGLEPEAAGKYPAFLDEPTSGLDPISAAAFDELLLYLQGELKLTVIMITHDLDTIFRTCTRVGVLVEGRMISDTLAGIAGNTQPWIHAYFQGERARERGLQHGT